MHVQSSSKCISLTQPPNKELCIKVFLNPKKRGNYGSVWVVSGLIRIFFGMLVMGFQNNLDRGVGGVSSI